RGWRFGVWEEWKQICPAEGALALHDAVGHFVAIPATGDDRWPRRPSRHAASPTRVRSALHHEDSWPGGSRGGRAVRSPWPAWRDSARRWRCRHRFHGDPTAAQPARTLLSPLDVDPHVKQLADRTVFAASYSFVHRRPM